VSIPIALSYASLLTNTQLSELQNIEKDIVHLRMSKRMAYNTSRAVSLLLVLGLQDQWGWCCERKNDDEHDKIIIFFVF
jgi:hypothetical protein